MKRPAYESRLICGFLYPALLLSLPFITSTFAEAPRSSVRISTNQTPITSHHHSFIVTDMPRHQALEIAIWAESVKDKLEEWTGMAMPRDAIYPMVISAEVRADDPLGRVLHAQAYAEDGWLRQEMTFINPGILDQEDALEVLCGLLLNRWLHARLPPANRRQTDPVRLPDWISVGIAQNLYPELFDRNMRMLKQQEAAGSPIYPPALWENAVLSYGRWPEKALAGITVSWMTTRQPRRIWFNEVIRQLYAGQALDADFFMGQMKCSNQRDFMMHWDLWLARQERRLIPGIYSTETDALRRILELRPEDSGLAFPTPLPQGRLSPDLLISARGEDWLRTYCQGINIELNEEMVGKSPELAAIIRQFTGFFQKLPVAVPSPKNKKKKTAVTDKELRNEWASAMGNLREFIRRDAARTTTLDAYAEPMPDALGTNAISLKRMLDAWENEAQTP